MKEGLMNSGIILAITSVVAFLIGIVMAIFGKNKKLAVKLIIGSIIGFIIGFGTCFANFSLGGHM
jgi:hypothetical protein